MATVSAASYEATVALESIVAAFGERLATQTVGATDADPNTPGIQLPTELGGTTVEVNGRRAGLFFVSPQQVNYVIPANTETGTATVVVRAGDGTVSQGTVKVSPVAPALFTANNDGKGAPAAYLLRILPTGEQRVESLAQPDPVTGRLTTKPINLGSENERLFLVLYLSGIRGAADDNRDGNHNEQVELVIGGQKLKPDYAGPQGAFVGLDQINMELSVATLRSSLSGRGRVSLSVIATGFTSSNLAEIEIAAPASTTPPQVTGFSAPTALAGQTMTINGAGFSPIPAGNLVRIGGVEARVMTASANQLAVIVPFGARSGPVSVRTPQGEGVSATQLLLRPSVSGVVEDTRRQPLSGVTLRVRGTDIVARTGAEGSFILPDVPVGPAAAVEVDGTTVPTAPPYPKLFVKIPVVASQDNQFPRPIALQQTVGPSLSVGAGSLNDSAETNSASSVTQAGGGRLQTGNVIFDIPEGAAFSFPDGGTSGTLTLSIVENSRTPVNLPAGQFSSTIPQIAPFSATLLPGGKLTFPNTDGYPAGSVVKLFRLDQTRNSPSLGSFVEAGTAVVSADGQRIETAPNAITEITQYFVSTTRQTTTVTGRVVDSDGMTPVRQALARCRGQEAFTDGNGGFILREVVVNPGDLISVEASFARPNGRVDRTQRSGIAAVVGGVTTVTPDLALPSEESNRPPVVLAPASIGVNEGETREVNFVASDPDRGQTIQLSISGANFASIIPRANDVYTLRLQTRANDAGRYTLMLVVTDNLGLSNTLNITLTVNRPPVASAQSVTTDEDTPRAITLTGSDPDGDPLSFIIVSNPLHGRLSGISTGGGSDRASVTYTPEVRYNGTDSFTFKVNDGLADSGVATVFIAINPVNHRPTLTVPGAQSANEGQELGFTVPATDIDANQTLTFSATNLPGGASFTQTSGTTARFGWTPGFAQAGSYVVTFRVTDNGVPALSDSKTVMITVSDVNRAPTLIVPGPQTVISGQNLSFTISVSDPDVGQAVSVSAIGLLAGASFDPASGLFTWTPNATQAGTHTVTFRASDNGTPVMSATQSVAITVAIQWRPTARIEGGSVSALLSHGPNLFAGTSGGGVFRSANQGQSWTAVNSGLTNMSVLALAVSDTNLFAGTRGVFRSNDNGQSWAPVNTGLPNTRVNSLFVIGTSIFAGTDNGVFVSTNQGQSWVAINVGLPLTSYAQSFAVIGTRLFVGLAGNGVFTSQ